MSLSLNRQKARDPAVEDDRVMSFAQWCEINSLSQATGRRLRKANKGPIFTQLSDRRVGVTVGNNRIWQAARAKPEADNVC